MGLQLRMKRQADEIIPLLKASNYRCKGAPGCDSYSPDLATVYPKSEGRQQDRREARKLAQRRTVGKLWQAPGTHPGIASGRSATIITRTHGCKLRPLAIPHRLSLRSGPPGTIESESSGEIEHEGQGSGKYFAAGFHGHCNRRCWTGVCK